MRLKAKAILSGLATRIPGYNWARATGGTGSARYCYSVWMRHLVSAHSVGGLPAGVPKAVAELGPGDSIGIGIAALLAGAERYFALDIVRYSNRERALRILDELVGLFAARERIPDETEFPSLKPPIDDYRFPAGLLGEERLRVSLAEPRVAAIRSAIEAGGDSQLIQYHVPWNDASVVQPRSVDHIYSQAVLEHIDDLEGAYLAMRRWLAPTGVMTHQIDYRCHGKADDWNGHWTYSDFTWKIVVGRRSYLLNRVPHSRQLALLRQAGFSILRERTFTSPSRLKRRRLAPRFRDLPEEDLTTSGAFIVAVRG